MSVNYSARAGDIIGVDFLCFSNMKLCCVFSLESPHPGDSNEDTQHTTISIKKENHPKLSKIQ